MLGLQFHLAHPFETDWIEMSSSPFELFRRNLKPMMVFLTLLALVSFVILPSIAMYQQQQMGAGGTETKLATFNGGDFDFNKVSYFTRNHYATTQFLRDLAELTISRGGAPKVAEFQYDPQSKQIQALGINPSPSDQSSVRTMMFAGEAKKAGLDLDDTAIRNWLTLYSDGRLSDAEINGVLANATRNQMGQVQLYEQLRTQLLAQAYQRQVMGGLASGGMPIVPPAKQWELFLRLNRRAVADAYAVNVADFIEKTNAKPSEKQIKEVYEEGKTAYPDEQSPKPAFRRPYNANIEYLAGNLNDFIDREIATLTEDQLKAEYQKRLDGGDFKLPEQPAETAPAETAPAETTPAETTPAETTPAETKPEEASAEDKPATEEMPAEEKPAADETPATEEKATAESETETKPATETPPAADAPPATEAPAAPEAPADTPAAADSSRLAKPSNGIQLVAARAQEDADAPKPADDAAKLAEDVAKATQEAAADKPADAPKEEPAKEEPAKATSDEAKPEMKEGDVPPAEDKPAEDKPAEDKPAEEKPAEAPEAKVEPFEKVRDDIARSLAMQPALNKLDAAVSEVDKTMRTYFNARALASGKKTKVPASPDLKALAEKLGMKHVVTGMMDGREIQEDPISLSFGVGTGMQRGEGFVQSMYVGRPQLYTPVRTVDDQAQVSYVAWKTEEKAEYIPELKEVREEVITSIRTAEARVLAKAEADRLAKEFAASDKPAKELVPAERANQYFEGIGPFSWMNSFGFGMRAFMGNVPELDRVGEAFMRQVFTSERDKWGVAPNMPETVYYVVKPTEFSPSTDELHQRFAQASQRMQIMSLAVEETIQIRDGHYEALDRRTGFKWNEKALENE